MTGIEWTNKTTMVDRDGRRVRTYTRVGEVNSPGTQERRQKLLLGLRWCRGCQDWLIAASVTRQGQCRPCTNASYRQNYAADGSAIRARVYARKRGLVPMPQPAVESLTEDFGGICAYCPEVATTWDHLHPVARGGATNPGNMVPACISCNSSKGTSEVMAWMEKTGRAPSMDLIDVLALDYFMDVA